MNTKKQSAASLQDKLNALPGRRDDLQTRKAALENALDAAVAAGDDTTRIIASIVTVESDLRGLELEQAALRRNLEKAQIYEMEARARELLKEATTHAAAAAKTAGKVVKLKDAYEQALSEHQRALYLRDAVIADAERLLRRAGWQAHEIDALVRSDG